MSRIRKMVQGRSLFLIVALAFVAIGVFVASLPNAEAITGPHICTYYKDATFKKVIGSRGTGCCGEAISWGSTSLYFKCQVIYCTDVICPF